MHRCTNVFIFLFLSVLAAPPFVAAITERSMLRSGRRMQRRGVGANTLEADSGDASKEAADNDEDADDSEDDTADDNDSDDAQTNGTQASQIHAQSGALHVSGDGALTEKSQAMLAMEKRLQDQIKRAQAPLDEIHSRMSRIEAEIKDLDNTTKGEQQIDDSVSKVAAETQSDAMAKFLGDLWKENRMFSEPFYKEHLEEQLRSLQPQEGSLQKSLIQAKTSMAAQQERWKMEAEAEQAVEHAHRAKEQVSFVDEAQAATVVPTIKGLIARVCGFFHKFL